MKMKLLLTLGISALLSAKAFAQDPISFSTPTQISDAGILTAGVNLAAYFTSAGNGFGTVAVDGVNFAEVDDATSGGNQPDGSTAYTSPSGISFSYAPGPTVGYSDFGGFNTAPYNTLSTGLQDILGGASYANNSTTVSLTGLSAGVSYTFELLVNDSRSATAGRFQTLSDTSGLMTTSGNQIFDTTSANGGIGEYVTGTFVASGTSEALSLNVGDGGVTQINAFELTSVPEPSSWALVGCSSLALVRFLRRRSAA